MGLLVISFITWGIGDMFKSNASIVAKIGRESISINEFQHALKQETHNLQQMFGDALTIEQMRSFGLVDMVLNKLISNKLLEAESKNLKLFVSNKVILDLIKKDSNFHKNNKFNEEKFNQLLTANNITPDQYLEMLKKEFSTKILAGNFIKPYPILDQIKENVYYYNNEKRIVDLIKITVDSINKPDHFTEDELQNFYEKHKNNYQLPEYRKISYIHLNPNSFEQKITITEEELHKLYNDTINNYLIQETRDFYNFVFPNEQEAKIFQNKLKNQNFEDSLNDYKNTYPNKTPKNINVETNLIATEIKETIRDLNIGEISGLIKTSFGYCIIKLDNINQQKYKPLYEVKEELTLNLKQQKLDNYIIALIRSIDDDLAGGTSIQELSDKLNIAMKTTGFFDFEGSNEHKQRLDNLPTQDDFITKIFDYDENMEAEIIETKDHNYFVVKIEEIKPSTLMSFNQAKAIVREGLTDHYTSTKMQELAVKIFEKLNNDNIIDNIISNNKVNMQHNVILTRFNQDNHLPQELVNNIFNLNINQFTPPYKNTNGEYILAIVKNITRPNSINHEDLKIVSEELSRTIQDEISEQYFNYLQKKYSIKITDTFHKLKEQI